MTMQCYKKIAATSSMTNFISAEIGGIKLIGYNFMIFLNQIDNKYKPIVCALKNYNLNSREQFEPGPGFEPRTIRSLAWCSTT